jgi:hypothetical protein
MPDEQPDSRRISPWSPVIIIAATILGSILLMIGAAVLNLDYGRVLARMSQVEFARGLITYLFAVATIGTAVVMIVYALSPDRNDNAFEHGKEILSLLLGIFGTIVGFYFGREVSKAPAEETPIVAPLKLSSSTAAPGQMIHLTTVASGGKAPLRFGIAFSNEKPRLTESPAPGGWIDTDVTVPPEQKPGQVELKVVVDDADNTETQQSANITVQSSINKK